MLYSPTITATQKHIVVTQSLRMEFKLFCMIKYDILFLEKEMETHSSVLAWRILWREEHGGLLSMGSHRVRHN